MTSGMAHSSQPENRGLCPVTRRQETMEPTGSLPFAADTTAAHRSGPREHGRQAARSKRSRTAGQARKQHKPTTPAPAQPAP
jgi:hypothetical protein